MQTAVGQDKQTIPINEEEKEKSTPDVVRDNKTTKPVQEEEKKESKPNLLNVGKPNLINDSGVLKKPLFGSQVTPATLIQNKLNEIANATTEDTDKTEGSTPGTQKSLFAQSIESRIKYAND